MGANPLLLIPPPVLRVWWGVLSLSFYPDLVAVFAAHELADGPRYPKYLLVPYWNRIHLARSTKGCQIAFLCAPVGRGLPKTIYPLSQGAIVPVIRGSYENRRQIRDNVA
jgi:hypothetical protein